MIEFVSKLQPKAFIADTLWNCKYINIQIHQFWYSDWLVSRQTLGNADCLKKFEGSSCLTIRTDRNRLVLMVITDHRIYVHPRTGCFQTVTFINLPHELIRVHPHTHLLWFNVNDYFQIILFESLPSGSKGSLDPAPMQVWIDLQVCHQIIKCRIQVLCKKT